MIKLKIYAAAIGTFILAVLSFGAYKKNEGQKNNQRKQEEIDHETARDIRKRAADVERVPDDKLKFRD